jgi:nickel-dependent lactate racemase
MKLDIPYLHTAYPLEFPDKNLLAVAEPNEFSFQLDPKTALAQALAGPQGLASFLAGATNVLIIINDATRPTPTAAILDGLLPILDSAKLETESITLMVATGAHRAPAEPEYRQILGGHYTRLRSRCVYHDARKDADMADLGFTRNGTPILLNKRIFEADRIIITGSVEPHYFAGFTGGRKAFLPGIAAYKTIQANHKQALSPRARSLVLEGNPVHEDMMDALPLIKKPVFSVMTVLDKEQRPAAVYAGDIISSFNAAVESARKIFCVPVPALADIVVAAAKFPMDIDLYQSQKAIDNGGIALKDGGTLILISSCRDGIGDETYAGLLAQAASPADALRKIEAGYKLGYHKAAKMAAVSERALIKAVTELPEKQLKSLFIEKAPSPQQALDEALERARKRGTAEPTILILPDACVTVPDPVLPA